jgi:hypothetical protein
VVGRIQNFGCNRRLNLIDQLPVNRNSAVRRVSTQDQNLELQTEALTKAGCKKVFEDKISGSRA